MQHWLIQIQASLLSMDAMMRIRKSAKTKQQRDSLLLFPPPREMAARPGQNGGAISSPCSSPSDPCSDNAGRNGAPSRSNTCIPSRIEWKHWEFIEITVSYRFNVDPCYWS